MPGFHIHISASTVLGIGYGGLGFVAYGVPPSTAALSTVLCSVSGMLPDLDSGPGRPLHESVCFAAAAIPMMMADRFKHMGWDHESIILAGAVLYLLIRFGLGHLLKKCTVHRGIFHSLPVALIFAEIGFLVCTTGNLDMRYYKAGAIVLGFMSHLILDEIWSVDFKHAKLKSSFGTAIKLWAPCRWATAVAYTIMIITTLLTLNDPIWSTASVGEQELHTVASRVVGGFEQETARIQKSEQKPADPTLR
ncbi:MAG TPA: metal-dependent hydrolase [Pirellulales bacterium]|jgi:hypothetical protein|nr:metal-dependent hydrolase [Pirellulales bacterium]